MEFLGYVRPDGSVGARNYVYILAADRLVNLAAHRVHTWVAGTRCLPNPGAEGRPSKDRTHLARVLAGLAKNPNCAACLVLGVTEAGGYPELRAVDLAHTVATTGKPVQLLTVAGAGSETRLVEQAIEVARDLVQAASDARREPAPLSRLQVGVMCGLSDTTSGLSGNPTFGQALDLLVAAGGTALFSETTEVIGAEEQLGAQAPDPAVRQELVRKVDYIEARAKAAGEDIRTINPIPANIAAGLTTIEEKSLGAIQKGGTSPLAGVLEYATRPPGSGLYFMDGWMSPNSLPMSMAAAGCQITLYQLGGGDLVGGPPPILVTNTGVVAPLLMCSGNPNTWAQARSRLDFSSGDVLLGTETVAAAGERLLAQVVRVASGSLCRGETIQYSDPLEVYFEGPFL